MTLQPEKENETPAAYCERTIKGVKVKADHNKAESLRCFLIIITSTLCTPMFIAFGEGAFWGKGVPSFFSLLAAAATSWVQLRRPQQLWGLYRTAQRELEDQQTKHRYRLADYAEAADADKLLAEQVASIAMNLHQQWIPLLPNPETLKAIEKDKPTKLAPPSPKAINHD